MRSGDELIASPCMRFTYAAGIMALWSARRLIVGGLGIALVGPVVPGTLQLREQQRRAA